MKKILFALVGASLLTAACAANNTTTGTTASKKSRLHACASEEAVNAISNGTAFTNGLTQTAQNITKSCLKKLALEDSGLDQETLNLTSTLLSNMMNASK